MADVDVRVLWHVGEGSRTYGGIREASLAHLNGVRGLERVEVERGVLRVDRELLPDVPDASEHPQCVNAPVHAW